MSASRSSNPSQEPPPRSPTTSGNEQLEQRNNNDVGRTKPSEHVSIERDGRRSRSPEGRHRTKRKDAGFKWKEKRMNDKQVHDDDDTLRRGYKDHYRTRSRSRSPRRQEHGYLSSWTRDRDDPQRDRERNRDQPRNNDSHEKSSRKEKTSHSSGKKAAAVPTTTAPQQSMILVTINDRLGTKKQIPCFPTDTVRDFKMIVASMIGRQPHEILLKRQGERPFKDILTLQDYGVSHNVQLDLEVDTGD